MNKINLKLAILLSTVVLHARPPLPKPGITPSLRPVLDKRDETYVTYAILGKAHYSVKKMNIGFRELSRLTGVSDADSKYVEEQLTEQARDYLAYYLQSSYPELANIPLVSCFYSNTISEWAAGFNPYVLAAAFVYYEYQEMVVSEHVRQHVYAFMTPADGYYSINTWVPGDVDKPDSMIKIYSHGIGTSRLYYNYDQTNVSDRTIHARVWLPKGANTVVVSVGSGSLNFHSAGHLESVSMDNDNYVNWIVEDSPAAIKRVKLCEVLPTPGVSYNDFIDFVYPGLQNTNIIDGNVVYTDLKVANPAITQFYNGNQTVQIGGQPSWPNDFWTYNLGTWRYNRLMAHSSSEPRMVGYRAYFQITRDPDQIFSDFMTPYYPNAAPASWNDVILENIIQAEQQN